MRNGFLGSLLAVLMGGGVAWSQPEGPSRTGTASEPSEGWTAKRAGGPANSPARADNASEPSDGGSSWLPWAGSPTARPQAAGTPIEGLQQVPCGSTAGHAVCAVPGRCGPPFRYWASAEYLMWWTRDDRLPPLVTTGGPPGTGALGQPSTVVLFGGDVDYRVRPGVRLTAGMWLDDCQTKGVEVSTFGLLSDSVDFEASSPGSPLLARPFLDPITGLPDSELVAFPGVLAGGVTVDTYSKLKGCEANALCNLKCCYQCDPCGNWQGGRLDLLVGVRYLQLDEQVTVTENILVLPGAPLLGTFPNIGGLPFVGGTRIGVQDQFRTENRFYGGQVGLRGEYAFADGLFVSATGKLALGVMDQRVDIEGATAVVTPAGSAVALGGLLAQTTNIGDHDRSRFAAVSELNLNVGYQVDTNLRVFAGYTFLHVSNVVRPGDVIDTVVNPTRVPTSLVPATGPLRPAFTFRDSDFWAQGFSIGAEVRY